MDGRIARSLERLALAPPPKSWIPPTATPRPTRSARAAMMSSTVRAPVCCDLSTRRLEPGPTVVVVSDQSFVSYELSWWAYVVESRGREPGSLWRVVDPAMTADELADLAWETPCDRLWVFGQGAYLQPPHPRAGTQCWLLVGDNATMPTTVISREPDGDRPIDVIDIGGAWAAEWLGPPADCVIARADRGEQMTFHRRLRG